MRKPNKLVLIPIGERLKSLRTERELSRNSLYDMISDNETDPDSASKIVRDWENGNHAMSIEILIKLCNALSCDTDYLLGGIVAKTHTIQDISDRTGFSTSFVEEIITEKDKDDRSWDINEWPLFYPSKNRHLDILELLYNDGVILDQISEYLKLKQLNTNNNPRLTITNSDGEISIDGNSANIEISKQIILNNIRDRLNVVAADLKRQSLQNKANDLTNTNAKDSFLISKTESVPWSDEDIDTLMDFIGRNDNTKTDQSGKKR